MYVYATKGNKEDWQGVSASKDAIAYILLIHQENKETLTKAYIALKYLKY
jgi:hypothetical protein